METKNTKMIAVLCAMIALAGFATARAAEEAKLTDEQLLEEGLTKKEDPYEISLGLGARAYTSHHDALQTRSDRQNDNAEDWRDGKGDGSGWGFIAAVARGTSRLQLQLSGADLDYKLDQKNYSHHIKSDRRDFDLEWQERSGQSERATWGWSLGVRRITLDERVSIRENKAKLDVDDGITWTLAHAGYWGNIEPFGNKVLSIYGNTHLLLGEATGIARTGSDLNNADGKIEETYADEYSVGYGLNGTLGVAFRIHKRVGLNVEYYREWLYSFDSTGSGIVVFPDNNDALFIENAYGMNAYVSVYW